MAACEDCWNEAFSIAYGTLRSQAEVYHELVRAQNECPHKKKNAYEADPQEMQGLHRTQVG